MTFVSPFHPDQIIANLYQMTRFHRDFIVPTFFKYYIGKIACRSLNSLNVPVLTLLERVMSKILFISLRAESKVLLFFKPSMF